MEKTSRKRLNKIKVVKGLGRGKRLGIPTVNFDAESARDLEHGIYVCKVFAPNEYWGVMHFGPRPAFGEKDPSLEVHLLDFDEAGEISSEVDIEIYSFIRDILNFDSTEDLLAAIETDIASAREVISSQN